MLLSSITLKNLLSFKNATLDVRPLNVLIGPNGSGKSNFLEDIGLLQAAPMDLNRAVMQGGGVREWIWRGQEEIASSASIQSSVMQGSTPYLYQIEFREHPQGLWIESEHFQNAAPAPGQVGPTYFARNGEEVFFPQSAGKGQLAVQESVFRSYRNPADPTPITYLGEVLRAYESTASSARAPIRRHAGVWPLAV